MNHPKDSQRGAALITALLLVALMAMVAVQLVNLTRFATARTAWIDRGAQAYWYAQGARELAELALVKSGEASRPVMRSDELWMSGLQVFPVEGGLVSGEIRDGANCLNLNALAPENADDPVTRQELEAQAQWSRRSFILLANQSEVPVGLAETVLAQLVDWIDRDGQPELKGAEDQTYARFDPPYLTANQSLVELMELRALPAMTPALFEVLARFACVRPINSQPALNLNSLRLEQAGLLSTVFDGRLSRSDAETVLFRRPAAGYEALAEFWADPLIARLKPDDDMRARVGLTTHWFELDLRVRLNGARFEMEQLVELTRSGEVRLVNQRFGAVL